MYTALQGTLTRDRETRAGTHFEGNARGAAGSPNRVMLRRLHVAFYLALVAAVCAPLYAVTPGTVSGVVRDSSGKPQIGAVVQLLRSDMSALASVYTDDKGHYAFAGILPGRYSLKAMGASFLPSLRENVRVRSTTVVNLTLTTLYEVMQWLPAQPRAASAQRDDWAWTLRSAANRPLLRWLEDGPLVVVTDSSGARPKLKARLVATGQQGTFGESGERITASMETTPEGSRELLARVDFAPDSDAAMESMLGFRQDLGFAGSVQSVAAIAIHPEISGGGADGLDEAGFQSWEEINMGDALEAEVGAAQVMALLRKDQPEATLAALPFASVAWRKGDETIRYRMATAVPAPMVTDESSARYYLPAVTVRNGAPALERGLHQEIGWQRIKDDSAMEILVYRDSLENPVLEAAAHGAGVQALAGGDALLDNVSGILRMAGPQFTSVGMQASLEHTIGGGNHMRLTYANGNALVMDAPARGVPLAQLVSKSHPRHVQMYALSLSGTLEGTGTKWRASYRWQPADTVTRVAPYTLDAAEPYLNIHLRQPVRVLRQGGAGIEALLDVNNLLAEGYQPYVLSDGSLLLFAQNQRAIRAGLAFTF